MTTSENLSKSLYSDNTEEFMALANSLATEGTTESVGVLLSCFADDFDYYDEMTVLMHAIERVNPKVVYASLSMGLPELNKRAPGWCQELVKRHLRAPGTAEEGQYSVAAFVAAMKAVPASWSIADSIANKLVTEEQIPAKVLSHFT